MYREKKITIVAPAYNEKDAMVYVMERIASFVDEIIVVDSSTDKTGEIARKMGATVIREEKRGYGRAYKTGFKYASGDIIVTTDCDGTYPTGEKDLPDILDYFLDNNFDFLTTSRFPMKFDRRIMPLRRILGNKFLAFMARVLFHGNFHDILSGMWILKPEVVHKLKLVDDGWNLSEEIKIRAFLGKTIKFGEIHIPYRVRIGTSKLESTFLQYLYYPYKTGLENLFFMFKMKWRKSTLYPSD